MIVFEEEYPDECYNCYGNCSDCPYSCGEIYDPDAKDD